jgi:hypothetical protein
MYILSNPTQTTYTFTTSSKYTLTQHPPLYISSFTKLRPSPKIKTPYRAAKTMLHIKLPRLIKVVSNTN